MANPTRPSYRPNLNRNPTKKWAEAQSVDYGGDDWGDDDYDDDDYEQSQHGPVSAGSQRYPTWGQASGHSAQRSFTNPALTVDTGRTSFDRDDERRHFSAGGYDSRFQAQPHPSQFLQQDIGEPHNRGQTNPPLQIDTKTSVPPTHSTLQSGPRNSQNDPYGAPHSAPASHLPQHSQSDTSSFTQSTSGRNFPQEDRDRSRDASVTKPFPDRHDPIHPQPPLKTIGLVGSEESIQTHDTPHSLDAKPLPFIRPADIYKRMEEEREKERRSQESSRPSIDSASEKATSSSARSTELQTTKERHVLPAEAGTSVATKPMIDTMQERKAGHNLSPISERSARSPIGPFTAETPTTMANAEAHRPLIPSRTASSVYTDHQDPTSASSTGPSIVHHEQGPVRSSATITPRQPAQYSPMTSAPPGLLAAEQTQQAGEDLPNFNQGMSSKPLSAPVDRTLGLAENMSHRDEIIPATSRTQEYQPLSTSESERHSTFDVENNLNLSPMTSRDTFPRSNSNSTPDISPITSRTAGISHDRDTLSAPRPQIATAEPQAELPKFDRAGPAAGMGTSRGTADGTMLPATTFTPERQQGTALPSIQTSRAPQHLNPTRPVVSDPQHRTIPATAPIAPVLSHDSATHATPSVQETPFVQDRSPHKPSVSQNELMPPPTSRTASEDWHDWQAQRKQFNAKHGIQDSDTASPALSSPISRAESPAKGTVRDIAERLESNSGRSSPVNQILPDNRAPVLDKPLSSRNETFRPALPGGWVSYTNIPTQPESIEAPTKIQTTQHPPLINDNSRTESTDSIPTAKAPRQWQSSNTGTMEAAFAAAAAAGSAMMGAFSGSALTRNKRADSETSSEDDENSVLDQPRPPESSETRDFASSPLHGHHQTHNVNVLPSTASAPGRNDVGRGINTTEPQHHVDIPAPLRTSRSDDSNITSPRISIPSITSLQHAQDHERLEDEIVQSLTPKTSRMDDSQLRSATTFNKPHETTNRSSQQVSSISDEDEISHLDDRSFRDDRPPSLTPKDASLSSNAQTPTKVVSRPPIPVVNIPDTAGTPDNTSTKPRPFLEQRYSWETGPDNHERAADTPALNFAKGLSKDRSVTPPLQSILPRSSTLSPPVPIVSKVEEEHSQVTGNAGASLNAPTTSSIATAHHQSPTTVRPLGASLFPQEQIAFKDILAYKDSTQRIRAFEGNRHAYAQPNNLLEQWLTSMNIPEHRDVFDGRRVPKQQPQVAVNNIRPSPRRDTTSASGTKLMQEDGKRLLAAAGKYSGRAGNVAKGFFSKGKDRLRTASSSDKVPTINRRRSSSYRRSESFDIDPPFVPRSQESVLPDKAPQIPTPALDTPSGESWSMLSSMFQERSQQANTGSAITSTGLNFDNTEGSSATRGTFEPNRLSTLTQHDRQDIRSSVATPPTSAVVAMPGSSKLATNPSALPNYDAGVNDRTGGPTHGLDETNNSTIPQDMKSTSNVVGVDDRTPHHQRVGSLPVPHKRRPSSISDVSDISVAPDESKDVPHRSVSPALDSRSRAPTTPATHTAHSSKHDEALQNKTSVDEVNLPAYDTATSNVVDKRQSKIAPGTRIVPVTDLKAAEAEEIQQTGSRPFSFFGSETLNHALSQQARLHSQRETMQESPVEDNIRVDMEKGPQPNITEHPAYRNSEEVRREAQLENPLPSSRRAPQEFEQYRQRQQLITVPQVPPIPQGLQRGQAEDGYRIPGPYVQEYRSPRPSKPPVGQYPSQDSHESSGYSSSTTPAAPNRLSGAPARNDASSHANQYQQRPDFERSRSRTFGGLFRTRSKSQSRRQARDAGYNSTQNLDTLPDESKRRRGLFGLGNRSSSPTGRANDWQGQSSSAPDSGRGRKSSMDMLRPANGSKFQTDTKKKRSSGFGSLFGKSGTRDREDYRSEDYGRENYRNDDYRRDGYRPEPKASPPFPSDSQKSHGDYNQYPTTMQQSISAPEQRYGPLNSNQTAYPQYSASPTVAMQHQYGMPGTAYQETKAYYGPGGPPVQSDQANVDSWQPTPDRPQIYTGLPTNTITAVPRGPNLFQAGVNTAVPPVSSSPSIPVTRTNRDISHTQDRSYASPTSESKPDMVDHVKNLHKRSRSPRLGRPSSDEHLHGSVVDQTNFNRGGQQVPQNPAAQLGMFHNKKISPGGGVPRSEEEQEKPWIIGLPNAGEDDNGDRNSHRRHQEHMRGTHGPSGTLTESGIVSPSTPYQRAYQDNIGETVSPVTAVEPRGHSLDALASGNTRNNVLTAPHHQPQHREHVNVVEPRQTVTPAVVEQISVPPTLSSAMQIPDPQPRAHHTPPAETAVTSQVLGPKPQSHDNTVSRALTAGRVVDSEQPAYDDTTHATTADQHISTSLSSVAPPSQASRTLKRMSIERAPENYQTASPTSARPLTVAEKVMGIQPTARGTVPEHRSTTPIPNSPAPSLGGPPKTTTWPDNKPSTTAISTTNTTPTTVTTTTMRSGSKLNKGSTKTRTYVIDSNTPSRSNSNAVANSSKKIIDPDQSTTRSNISAPLEGTNMNTVNTATAPIEPPTTTDVLPISTGSKRSVKKISAPSHGKSFEAFELPGSRPDGYESEEEILMSATAYPGQEWMPEYAQGVNWDD